MPQEETFWSIRYLQHVAKPWQRTARPSGEGRRKKQSASGSDWSAGRVEDLFQNISSNRM